MRYGLFYTLLVIADRRHPVPVQLFIVPQQQAYIIKRFGKFNKVQFAGIHIQICSACDRTAMKTNTPTN